MPPLPCFGASQPRGCGSHIGLGHGILATSRTIGWRASAHPQGRSAENDRAPAHHSCVSTRAPPAPHGIMFDLCRAQEAMRMCGARLRSLILILILILIQGNPPMTAPAAPAPDPRRVPLKIFWQRRSRRRQARLLGTLACLGQPHEQILCCRARLHHRAAPDCHEMVAGCCPLADAAVEALLQARRRWSKRETLP